MNKQDKKGISRRDMLRFGAAASAASAAAVAASQSAQADSMNDPVVGSNRPSSARPDAKYIVECHCHVGSSPGTAKLTEKVKSASDWAAFRTKEPELYAKVMAEEYGDDSDILFETMDKHGVTHALVQYVPGMTATNDRTAEIARGSKGRFFPLYRPDFLVGAQVGGTLTEANDKDVFASNARRIADAIDSDFPEWGMIGVGEVIPGGMVTNSSDPLEIARAMGPIMEALSKNGLPIQIPTGYTGWKGTLHHTWMPLYVDEMAGNFPKVPIVLIKMGRGFRTSFDTCLVTALRNANVYLETTDAKSEFITEAAQKLGSDRIMFGSDFTVMSRNYTYEHNFREINGASLTQDDVENICWRTANEVYKLGLEA